MGRALLTMVTWLLAMPAAAGATEIRYSVAPLGGSRWLFTYDVTNDSLPAVDEFSILFDVATFSNLSVATSPPSWDAIVLQPDTGLPADGLFDALAIDVAIPLHGVLGGFAVAADFLGSGAPSAQPFQVIDPETFAVLESGRTALAPVVGIDAPPSVWLCLVGLAGLVVGRRKRGHRDITRRAAPRAQGWRAPARASRVVVTGH